jgi:hypothetical protein
MFLFLRIEPSKIRKVYWWLAQHVSQEFDAIECRKPARIVSKVRVDGVYYAVGRFDILVELSGESNGALSRFFYQTISTIDRRFGQTVTDATKILAVEWDNVGVYSDSSPPVAFIQVKLKNPFRVFPAKGPTLLAKLKSLGTRYTFRAFAGLSWHEALILLNARSVGKVIDFHREVLSGQKRAKRLREVMTTVVWDPSGKYDTEKLDFSLALKITDYAKYSTVGQSEKKERHCFGMIDVIRSEAAQNLGEIDEILNHYEVSERNRGLRKYSTNFFLPAVIGAGSDTCNDQIGIGGENNSSELAPIRSSEPIKFTRRLYGGRLNVIHEKIDALRAQLAIVRNNSRLSYLVTEDLLQTLRAVHGASGGFSEVDILGYLSMIRHAVQQRLWGTHPPSGPGFITGFADGFGGYQRILLACEAFMERAMSIMLHEITKPPPMLILFDHPGLDEQDLTAYRRVRHFYNRAPIIVRLPGFKYQPWYWHRGIWSIAEWSRELTSIISSQISQLRRSSQRIPGRAHFCSLVIQRGTLWRLLIDESSTTCVIKRGRQSVTIDRSEHERMLEIFTILPDISKNRDVYSIELERELQSLLLNGKICCEDILSHDIAFRALVNAYYGLPMDRRRTPKTVNAFILSLYCAGRRIR